MLRRHPSPVRALWAAGLLSLAAAAPSMAQATDPAPGPEATPEAVDILQAKRAGDLAVTARGHGESSVKFTLKNTTNRRLKVIIPPGLVASSAAAQGAFQSMGLGTPTDSPGSFGRFRRAPTDGGFRSIGTEGPDDSAINVPPGHPVEFLLPSVCLNYGINTPTHRDVFELVDIDEYTPDVRVRKALRSLATYGTSQGVAQAVMWHVCNGLSYEQLARNGAKQLNLHEIGLAARFIAALDASGSSDLVDPSALTQARILVRIQGEGSLYKDAKRLSSELEGTRVMGLPVQVVSDLPDRRDQFAALHLSVSLTGSSSGRIAVRHAPINAPGWVYLGGAAFQSGEGELNGGSLADSIDRAMASAFVASRPIQRGKGITMLRIVNRLPFTLTDVVVKTGKSDDAGRVTLSGVGVGPARNALATIPSADGKVERVVLNGL